MYFSRAGVSERGDSHIPDYKRFFIGGLAAFFWTISHTNSLPSGDSEDPGPGAAGGVLESSRGHGGLLYPPTAQRHGVLHPGCEDSVGGRTELTLNRESFVVLMRRNRVL